MSFQLRRNIGIQPHRGTWERVQDGFEDDSRAFATEGQRPCRHLVQHRPEGEQIGARIQFLGPHLLRRHVSDGAERRAGAGQVLLRVDGHGVRVGNRSRWLSE